MSAFCGFVLVLVRDFCGRVLGVVSALFSETLVLVRAFCVRGLKFLYPLLVWVGSRTIILRLVRLDCMSSVMANVHGNYPQSLFLLLGFGFEFRRHGRCCTGGAMQADGTVVLSTVLT